ncbi:hypothetical protein YC2023_058240 [Brassica napus]
MEASVRSGGACSASLVVAWLRFSSMADTAMSLEASLCLSGFSLRKIKVFESFTVSHLLCVRSAVSVSSLQRGVTAQR